MLSFSTALSALNADEESVDVVGNNLANLNTAGFKSTSMAFSDMVSETMSSGSVQIGSGVKAATVRDFSQGPVQSSGRQLDAAIQGSGFFVTQDANSQTIYTRVGSFKLNSDGYLVTQTGSKVLGYVPDANGKVSAAGNPQPITVPVKKLDPKATTEMSFDLNLDAVDDTSGNGFPAPMSVIDSQGFEHIVTVTFTKDTTTPNTWSYQVALSADDVAAGATVTLGSGSSGTLVFDKSGKFDLAANSSTSDTITIQGLNGADDMTVNWNFLDSAGAARFTQFNAASSISSMNQNGYKASELSQVAILDGGKVVAKYENGMQQEVGLLALASFRNPDTLQGVGNNGFITTTATSAAALGGPNTGGRGQVMGASLEGSNVDIAKEFTNLIVYQRGYQAAAKIITTADEMSRQTINLIQ